jgi:hypothetical protein
MERMMSRFAIYCAIIGMFIAADSSCMAQGNVLPTAPPPDKKPCEALTKAEAEAIMLQPAEGRSSRPFDCWYVESGWTNRSDCRPYKRHTTAQRSG